MKKLLLLLPFTLLYSKGPHSDPDIPKVDDSPWLTGPLLSPSGHTIPYGHANYEPYLYWTINNAKYDQHWNSQKTPTSTNILMQGSIQLGVGPGVELDLAPQLYYNFSQGQDAWRIGDFPLVLSFQILQDAPDNYLPALKLRFSTQIPIGKYDRLNPHKKGTDIGGGGNWNPSVGVVLSRLFHFSGTHWLSARYFIGYYFGTPVHVHGLNNYGGSSRTRGAVYPGNAILTILGLEYTLSRNWALACDLLYQHQNRTRFSGKRGGVPSTAPSSEQFVVAPALEYNFSANIGLIAGPAITFAGRNATKYISWIGAINIYY